MIPSSLLSPPTDQPAPGCSLEPSPHTEPSNPSSAPGCSPEPPTAPPDSPAPYGGAPAPSPPSCPPAAPQNQEEEEEEECRNGPECKFRRWNRCSYFHPDQSEFEQNRYDQLSDSEKRLVQQVSPEIAQQFQHP